MSYENVTVADGKYTVCIGVGAHAGHLKALRYGEEWQDLTGNNLVYYLAAEVRDLRAQLEGHKETIDVLRGQRADTLSAQAYEAQARLGGTP